MAALTSSFLLEYPVKPKPTWIFLEARRYYIVSGTDSHHFWYRNETSLIYIYLNVFSSCFVITTYTRCYKWIVLAYIRCYLINHFKKIVPAFNTKSTYFTYNARTKNLLETLFLEEMISLIFKNEVLITLHRINLEKFKFINKVICIKMKSNHGPLLTKAFRVTLQTQNILSKRQIWWK